MRPKTIVVCALAGPPAIIGKVFDAVNFADAIFLSAQAKQAGYDGTIYCVMDDGTFATFNAATKSFTAIDVWPFQ